MLATRRLDSSIARLDIRMAILLQSIDLPIMNIPRVQKSIILFLCCMPMVSTSEESQLGKSESRKSLYRATAVSELRRLGLDRLD